MSKEYIDREALEIELNHRLNFLMAKNGTYDHYTSGFDECVDKVENFPSADAVDVVLCCECKHWLDAEGIEERDGVRFARCDVHNFYHIDGNHYGWCPTEYDFCSCGEVKEGDDNA